MWVDKVYSKTDKGTDFWNFAMNYNRIVVKIKKTSSDEQIDLFTDDVRGERKKGEKKEKEKGKNVKCPITKWVRNWAGVLFFLPFCFFPFFLLFFSFFFDETRIPKTFRLEIFFPRWFIGRCILSNSLVWGLLSGICFIVFFKRKTSCFLPIFGLSCSSWKVRFLKMAIRFSCNWFRFYWNRKYFSFLSYNKLPVGIVNHAL